MLMTTHQPIIIGWGKKGQVKYSLLVMKEMHHTYLFPRMDEASQLLEDIVISQQQPPVSSHESFSQPTIG
jgi:hypothetical protein